MYNFVFTSTSIQRLELLRNIGYQPDKIISVDTCKNLLLRERPKDYIRRIVTSKTVEANKILSKVPLILSVYTVIVRNKLVLKFPSAPNVKSTTSQLLSALSGKRYSILTGVCIARDGSLFTRVSTTKVKLRVLTDIERDTIVNNISMASVGRDIVYDIYKALEAHIIWVIGHPSNLLGMPLYDIYNLLRGTKAGRLL